MDPQERRGELFHALRRLLRKPPRSGHRWSSTKTSTGRTRRRKSTSTLIADNLPASRVLVVLTYRTGYTHPFGERSYQTRVVPGALSERG